MSNIVEEPSARQADNEAVDDRGQSDIVDAVFAAVERQLQMQSLPTATYRIQFNQHCTFREIEEFVPYLFALGVSDLYASPFLQARPGSLHGYDVVNHAVINPEIGTRDELQSLRSTLRQHEMGLLADVVPNHMAADPVLNPWWQDVLENGPSSAFASHFDINWTPLKSDLAQKVLLPVLGNQYGKVLEDGQLIVRYGDGVFWLEYFEHRFPLSLRSYAAILAHRVEELQQELGDEHPDVLELLSILTAIKNLPHRSETDAELLVERRREKEVVKRRLNELVQRSSRLAEFVDENIRQINGRPGEPRSYDRLDELLQHQAYRLAYWRVAADEINYRRFFDINDLAAICTESPQVFAESHRLLFELLDQGTITGLRIDHPDGLYDPRGYLMALQERRFLQLCREAVADMTMPAAGSNGEPIGQPALEQRLLELWRPAAEISGSPLARPLYVVVEKILAKDEPLPEDWPVHGTVGYDFLNALNGVFVDPRGERKLTAFNHRFTKQSLSFAEMAYHDKRLIVRTSMASELSVLGYRLDAISERNRWTRDFTLNSLTRTLQEVISCFGIYRNYVQEGRVLERDRRYVEEAVALAKRRNPAMDASIFDFVRDVLLLNFRENADEEERSSLVRFVGKFQQLTGPIMAKAVEDTTNYRFNRLVSLNEVGGEPARFGISAEEFHRQNLARVPKWSHALNATSTHDTKRSEDVRARINVLSEIPKEWQDRVQRWSRWNRRLKTDLHGVEAPSRNSEYQLYQTLIGIWPDVPPSGEDHATFVARVRQYLQKVVREAKVNSSWISPNEPYEAALFKFIDGLFDPRHRQPFVRDLDEFARKVAVHGRWNSLSQLLLKLASPGVPDIYQGTELWTLTLVDPDNRQPVKLVEYRDLLNGLLADMAAALEVPNPSSVVESWLDVNTSRTDSSTSQVANLILRLLDDSAGGLIKLFATLIGLRTRRLFPQLFTVGTYEPLTVTGPHAEHLLAFLRRHEDRTMLVVVPRLTVRLCGFAGKPPIGDVWGDTKIHLPPACSGLRYFDVFTRCVVAPAESLLSLSVNDVLRHLPFALLMDAGS